MLVKELRHKYKVPSVLTLKKLYQLLSVFIQFGNNAEKKQYFETSIREY